MSSSWFSPSLPNPDDEESPPHSPIATPTATAKPDFSLITQTIGRQIHNVASFLAPPPQQPYSPKTPSPHTDHSGDVSPSSTSYQGMKNDLAEISGSLKTGLSLLSPKKAVNEISKFASNLLQFDKGDVDLDNFDVAGITDAVLDFVTGISNRPECWIDFPLSLQHKDFSMSQVQKDHVLAMQQLIPNLCTLRRTVHNYMSEEHFWMIYFILLLPRLNDVDYRLLSTPEIIEVREVLLQKLRNKKNTPTGSSEDDTTNENKISSEKGSHVNIYNQIENPFQEIKSSGEGSNARNRLKHENRPEDDVSFSDLEDEDNVDVSGRLSGVKQTQSSRLSSASETSDWVRLGETSKANHSSSYRERRSESEESSDWHAVEDVDL